MTDEERDKYARTGRWVIATVLMPCVLMWQGAVLMALWSWFITPLGAPRLPWINAMGVAMFFDVLSYKFGPKHKSDTGDMSEEVLKIQIGHLLMYTSIAVVASVLVLFM